MKWKPLYLPYEKDLETKPVLKKLAEDKVIHKFKLGKTNYYINQALMNALNI